MKAWTYATAKVGLPYWYSGSCSLIALEHDSGYLEWRRVDTGEVYTGASGPYREHKGKLLPVEYHPQWFRDLDDCGMDLGL